MAHYVHEGLYPKQDVYLPGPAKFRVGQSQSFIMLPLMIERNWMYGQITGYMGNDHCAHTKLSRRGMDRYNLMACDRVDAVFQRETSYSTDPGKSDKGEELVQLSPK